MQPGYTYTYVILDVSPLCYAEIRATLEAAGYGHAFHQNEGRTIIDMHGIAIGEDSDASLTKTIVAEAAAEFIAGAKSLAPIQLSSELRPGPPDEHGFETVVPTGRRTLTITGVFFESASEPAAIGAADERPGVAPGEAGPAAGAATETALICTACHELLTGPIWTSFQRPREIDGVNEYFCRTCFDVPLQRVESAHIRAAGWRDGKLRVLFTSGKLCEYDNVREFWFQSFLASESKGRFFTEIRRNPDAHPWREVPRA